MPEADRPAPLGEPLARALGAAARLGALAGASLGALEALRWLLLEPPRYAGWGSRLALVAVLGDALLGGLLGLVCGAVAWLLWRPPQHRAAPASACGGLGAAAGIAAWIGPLGGGFGAPLTAALGATLLALSLRELLAWWPLPWDSRAWSALLALAGMVLVARVATLPAAAAVPDAQDPAGPSVLLVSIDTLRADHLGCYGAADASTPTIDRLATEGVLFEEATAQSNTTGPSHTTMLTGLYPAEHGARSNGIPVSGRVATLGDALGERGWATAGFVSGFTMVDKASGLAERFQHYEDDLLAWDWITPGCERLRLVEALIESAAQRGVRVRRSDRPAGETVDLALDWLEPRAAAGQAFFLFVHLYDPHAPYEPPHEYAALHGAGDAVERELDWYALDTGARRALVGDPDARARMEALYRGEISYADAQVGRLVDALERSGRLDETLVVLVSDHGEGLGAHGYYYDHGTFLYDEELAVPLVLRLPDGRHAGSRVTPQVRLLDLAPTILELVGRPDALSSTGASLLPLVEGASASGNERPSFALADIGGELSGFELDGRRLALRRGGRKLIWTSEHWLDTERVPPRLEAYDLDRDPDELDDLAGAPDPALPDLFAPLQRELEAFREATAATGPAHELDPQVLEELRRLGYL